MFFDDPQYERDYSLVEGKIIIQGNTTFATTLERFVKEKCVNVVDLYEAQNITKEYCIQTHGQAFYEKNAEAIIFIVENEYCHIERKDRPLFDTERYEEDLRTSRLY